MKKSLKYFLIILFENLFKPRQRRLAVDMLLTSSVLSTTSKQCFELTSSVLSTTSKQCFELTSSVLSTTSKQCFEQPAASFLVCSLIFLEYKISKSVRNPRQDNPDASYNFKKYQFTWLAICRSAFSKRKLFS